MSIKGVERALPTSLEILTDLSSLLRDAFAHHQAGRLKEAEQLYRQILSQDESHADSLHLLGVIGSQTGRHELAVEMIQRAIAVKSGEAAYYSNLGAALRTLGRTQEAVDCYRQALTLQPGYMGAHYNLGNALCDLGKLEEALPHYEQALALWPDTFEQSETQNEDPHSRRQKPDSAEIYFMLGNISLARNDLKEATLFFERALTLRQDYAEAHNALGFVLEAAHLLDEAFEHYRIALDLKPWNAEFQSNLGNIYQAQGKLDEAIACHRRALQLQPGFAKGYNNLAVALAVQGKIDEAIALYDQALVLQPDYAQAQLNRAMLRLLRGDFVSGWRGYESRWEAKKQRSLEQPRWNGEPLNGVRILLHAEQGLGDCIQFLRYLPMVVAAGGSVVLEIPHRLRRLAAQLPSVTELIISGDPLPPFDVHCPLMSLPLAFATTLESIPAQTPYLAIPPEALETAADLSWPSTGLRVGMAWAGNPEFGKDLFRSMRLDQLEPLLSLEEVHFFSLQMGVAEAQLASTSAAITNLSPVTGDLADTAAQMAQMDLIVTVDTSIAHLAGALGKPVWVMLQLAPDWRWLMEGEDCPWYPSMRLFRQPKFGDWASVVEAVRSALVEQTTHRST
jgi:tetratricopeptide (TPR) repeat protein